MKPWPMLVALILLGGAAPPGDAQAKEDIRCLMAAAVLAGSEDPKLKQVGAAAGLYFLGRLDGHSPGLDIGAAVAAEEKSAARLDDALFKRCGETIQKRGDYLIAAGKALQARSKK